MNNVFEEILEAVWTAAEEDAHSIDAIRQRCPIPVEETDLLALQTRHMLTRDGVDQSVVTLSKEGERTARGVVRRHRLAVSLFGMVLDMDAAQREAIACEVEHTLLPEVEEAICTLLGHPTTTPDGFAIPTGSCCASKQSVATTVIAKLTDLAPGERGRITHIRANDPSRFRRLTAFGLRPGTVVEVRQHTPSFCIRYDGTELAIDEEIAEDIYTAKVR